MVGDPLDSTEMSMRTERDDDAAGGSFATYRVCGIRIAAVSSDAAANRIIGAAVDGVALQVHLCNSYTLSLVDRDSNLRMALGVSDLNLPDGWPVARLGRRVGAAAVVRGPTLLGDVIKLGRGAPVRHYLYGGAAGVAEKMAEKITDFEPTAEIVGMESPPYHDPSDEEL